MSRQLQKCALQLIAAIKDADQRKGIVTGYAANFNTLDSDNDIILPGAFAKSIREQGPGSAQPRIKHLLNHRSEQPIGVPLILKEDGTGLYYESQVGTHALGQDFIKMVDSGLITEHSIGYGVVRKNVVNPNADWRDQQTELIELKLWEFSSLTAWGANQNTPLTGIKSIGQVEDRLEKLINAIKNGTFTDSTFIMLEQELLFVQKAFNDLRNDRTSEPPTGGRTSEQDAKSLAAQIEAYSKQLLL